MTRYAIASLESLRPEHVDDLRKLSADPSHYLLPIRRRMYLRLQLINPCSQKPSPSEKRRRSKPKRVHTLTDAGMRAIGAEP